MIDPHNGVRDPQIVVIRPYPPRVHTLGYESGALRAQKQSLPAWAFQGDTDTAYVTDLRDGVAVDQDEVRELAGGDGAQILVVLWGGLALSPCGSPLMGGFRPLSGRLSPLFVRTERREGNHR